MSAPAVATLVATPETVAKHHERLRVAGHEAPTKATGRHFGISDTTTRRLIREWRAYAAAQRWPAAAPAEPATDPAAAPAEPAAAPATGPTHRVYRSDALRKLRTAQARRERDISVAERDALVAALLDEAPPEDEPAPTPAPAPFDAIAEAGRLAAELDRDAGAYRQRPRRQPAPAPTLAPAPQARPPAGVVVCLLVGAAFLALAAFFAADSQSWPQYAMELLEPPPPMTTRAPANTPTPAGEQAGVAPLPWQATPTATPEPATATTEPATATTEPPPVEPPPPPPPAPAYEPPPPPEPTICAIAQGPDGLQGRACGYGREALSAAALADLDRQLAERVPKIDPAAVAAATARAAAGHATAAAVAATQAAIQATNTARP